MVKRKWFYPNIKGVILAQFVATAVVAKRLIKAVVDGYRRYEDIKGHIGLGLIFVAKIITSIKSILTIESLSFTTNTFNLKEG